MALIFRADDHHFSVSLDDFALIAHGLYGRSDFHRELPRCYFGLEMASVLAAPRDATFGEIVGAHLELHIVALDDADVVHSELPRNIRRDDVPVGEPHFERGIGERFDDFSFGFDDVVLRHTTSVHLKG